MRLWDKVNESYLPVCGSGCVPESDVEGISPSQSSFSGVHSKTSSSLIYTWNGVTSPAAPGAAPFDVTMTAAAVDGSNGDPGRIELNIDVTYSGTHHSLFSVVFPRVGIAERVSGDPTGQYLISPFSSGLLIADPMHNTSLPPLDNPFPPQTHPGTLSMQFYGYYNSNEGPDAPLLFLGTRDLDGDIKEFFVERSPGAVNHAYLRLNRFPPDNLTATNFSPDYPYVMSVLEGDWYDAARYYRRWATSPGIPWTAQGPAHSDSTFPTFLKNAQMVLWSVANNCCASSDPTCTRYIFDYDSFAYWDEHVNEHKQFFGVSNLVTQIYGWDDNSFPFGDWGQWLPAHPEFAAAATTVSAIPGHSVLAYFNPNVYSEAAPYFGAVSTKLLQDEHLDWVEPSEFGSGAPKYYHSGATTDPNVTLACGDLAAQNPHASYSLDHRSKFIFNYTKSIAVAMKALGAKGLYLDAFSHVPARRSYNAVASADRGLPTGGGAGWLQGKLATMNDLRNSPDLVVNTTTGEKMGYSSEGVQELMLGRAHLLFPNHIDKPVFRFNGTTPDRLIAPIFNTVYHDYYVAGSAVQAVLPTSRLSQVTPDTFRELRMAYATKMFFGHGLFGGSTISSDMIADSRALSADYTLYTDLIRNYASILRFDEVRDFTTFGERMRDPSIADYQYTVETGDVYAPYGAQQPYVYVAAFRRTDPGPRPRLGLLLVNWSHSTDPTGAGGAPGNQTIDVTIDPAEHGMTGTYTVTEVRSTAGGAVQLVPYGTLNANLGPKTYQNIPVNQISARFFRFVPQ
ncbi:MAG: DUF6259 domain-containing protein [Planctomycetes bacterium]|nr:DUF6259 domain-containing protein [Planctomycetota bacterium]